MRARRAILFLALALALASLSAPPGEAARRIVAQAPATAEAGGLRGPLDSTAPVQGAASPPAPQLAFATTTLAGATPPAPAPAPASLAPLDGGQCRQACAHSYYFCLAGEDAQDCPTAWGQCLADCRQPVEASSDPR